MLNIAIWCLITVLSVKKFLFDRIMQCQMLPVMLDFLLKKMIINNITCDDIFLNE